MATPIDIVLEHVRQSLTAPRSEAAERVAAIHAAADAYLASLDRELGAAFAERAGLPSPFTEPPADRAELARALQAAVATLPELVPIEAPTPMPTPPTAPKLAAPPPTPSSTQAVKPQPASASSSASDGSRAWPQTPQTPQTPRPARATAPDVLALQRELEEAGLEHLSDRLFLAYAEEFAARARLLQERSLAEGDDEAVTRIIRKLTALAHRFNLPRPVFGLSRKHNVVDWRALADRARQQRELALSASNQAEGPAQRAPVREAAKHMAPANDDDDDDEKKDEPLDLPNLRKAAAHRQVLMVGGVCKNEKLDRIRERTGIEVEWISLAKGSNSSTIRALSTRIGNEKIAALVFLEELMDHREYEVLIAAARKVELPVSYGGKAGTASVERAFVELEEKIRATSAASN